MGKQEPYSRVEEVIKDTPTPIEVTSGAALACTIVAPKGPRLNRCLNDTQFLQDYTLDGKIPRNAHISFINAYYLSFFSELIIARSMNSEVTGGLAVYADQIGAGATLDYDRIYLKDGIELTRYYSLTFPVLPQTVPMNDADEVNDYSENFWGAVIDGTIYYGGDLDLVLAHFSRADKKEKVDLSSLDAVACDQLIDYSSSKSYTAQVIDFIASELNKGDEVVAVVNGNAIKVYCDDYTSINANIVSLPNDEGVFEDVEVYCGEITEQGIDGPKVTIAGPTNEPRKNKTRILTIKSKTPGSVDANEYKIQFSKTRYLTAEASGTMIKSIVFDMTIDGDTYLVSLDQKAVDSSGINCFIEALNTQDSSFNFEFKVEEVADLDKLQFSAFGPISFGEGFIDEDSSKSVTYLKSALNVLDDQELYRIRYFAGVGITSLPYVKAYSTMCERRKWFAPTDIPYDRTNYKAISAYTNQLLDSYNNYTVGPFDKNTGLTGWMVYIAASTLYWERVMTNRKAHCEFAPVFDKDTGIFAYSDPVKLLKKDQREKLLSLPLPVNYIIYDEAAQSHYMNDNWTHYSKNDNVAGEEMNVRMMHMISLDVQEIMKSFKAKINNARYRRLAYDSIDNYFKNTLMTQEYKPDDYLITVDETNNTPDVIKARRMKVRVQVRYFNSTKYIDVVNEAYAVGGAAFE